MRGVCDGGVRGAVGGGVGGERREREVSVWRGKEGEWRDGEGGETGRAEKAGCAWKRLEEERSGGAARGGREGAEGRMERGSE